MKKKKLFAISMAVLWGCVFTNSLNSAILGISLGILMGGSFGLFDSENTDDRE